MSCVTPFNFPCAKKLKTLGFWALVSATLMVLAGCAASGPKYIQLAYMGDPAASQGSIGIARFEDARKDKTKGELGFRLLNDKSKEFYLVHGLDLAATLLDQTQTFLERKGLKVSPVPPWSPDMEGLANAQGDEVRILTARINAFDLKAEKKGAVTEMVLNIDLSFFLGNRETNELTTIPVVLSLERTEVNFTLAKVENFFNQTLAEVLEKALPMN